MGKVVDCVWLSTLWLICSIPIVTAGASTVAMYYTVNKCIRYDRGYIASEFFSSFRANFKQATMIWSVLLVLFALLGVDFYIMKRFYEAGWAIGKLYVCFPVFMALIGMWLIYLFPYLARFENDLKSILKNTLFIAVGSFPWTLLMTVLFAVMIVVLLFLPPFVMLLPAVYNLIKNLILERIFQKFMTPEDLEAEKERNRVFYN